MILEIKECPFCGKDNAQPNIHDVADKMAHYYIECQNCKARGGRYIESQYDKIKGLRNATLLWNNRGDLEETVKIQGDTDEKPELADSQTQKNGPAKKKKSKQSNKEEQTPDNKQTDQVSGSV